MDYLGTDADKIAFEIGHDVVQPEKKLHRKTKAGQINLRAISTELARQGHLNESSKAFNPKSVAVMLGR